MSGNKISLSVVVPVYNEAENLRELFEEIKTVCETGMDGQPFDYEIIFVNDGSDDKTDAVCRTLAPLTYIRLRKNFGQTSAMDCGFKAATKELVAALDGDGQNDPADLPGMIRYLYENDLDVVSGWRVDRRDPVGKRIASRGANGLRKMIIHDGIHDSGCTLKVYRSECLKGLDLYGEQHRFIPALLKIRGFKIGEIPVAHRPRKAGKTKYGASRILKGFLDMISVWFWNKYASRPLHLQGTIGMAAILFGVICAVLTVVKSVQMGALDIHLLVLSAACFLMGLVLFALGLISEMIMKVYYRGEDIAPYQVKSVERFTGEEDEDPDDIA